MMSWSKALSSVAITLLAGGIAWLVASVVHGGSVQAVQSRDIADHGEQLHDHELRTRSLEAVVSLIAETQKQTSVILQRMEEREREQAPVRRQR